MACRVITPACEVRVPCASQARIVAFFRGGCPVKPRLRLHTRGFSRSRVPFDEFETLDVVCGSSGRITVELYNSKALQDPSAPLVLYLPPTGAHLRDAHPPIPHLLLAQKNTALAQINYRWNIPSTPTKSSSASAASDSPPSSSSHLPSLSAKAYPFPIPLHDTLHALDHLTNHLKKYTQSPTPPSSPYAAISSPKKRIQRPLLIHGSFLGGTLATSLALTESHTSPSNPFKVIGLITRNAVFDWSEFAATKPPSTSIPVEEGQDVLSTAKYSSKPWTSQTLHTLKPTLFASPQSAFDPFASPLLFFRTSGYSVPKGWPGTPIDTPEPKPLITSIISDPEEEVVSSPVSSTLDESEIESGKSKNEGESEEEEGEIGRRYPLKFPPSRSYTNPEADLELPRALFITTTSTPPYPSPSPTPSAKPVKSRSKQTEKLEPTPHLQALELQSRMYRSIEQQESRRNAQWEEWGNEYGDRDSDRDNNSGEQRKDSYAESVEERVKVLEISLDADLDAGGDSHDDEIRNWIEDVIG